MMPNITLGSTPANLQQKGERSARNGEVDGTRFDDALTSRSLESKPTKDGEDRQMDTRQDWKIDRYTALFSLEKTAQSKTLSDTPAFGDFLVEQEAATDPQRSAATDTEAPVDDALAGPDLPEDEGTETDDAPATPDAGIADGADPELAFASPQASVVHEPPVREMKTVGGKAGGEQDTPKEPTVTLSRNVADADQTDPQTRAAARPEPQSTPTKQAVQVSAAERTVPAADGQSPARTRTDASSPANTAIADKSAPATQPPTGAPHEAARFVSAKDGSFARGSAADAPAAKADPVSAKVNVLNFTAAPAPAPATPPVLSSTAAGLVAAIEAEGTWRATAQDPAISSAPRGAAVAGGVNTLRIQLQPVELGMVTARLVATGSQLSVEIQVESNDARQRLANDSEVIVKALRAIGYDIDKVTIQQGPQNGQSPAQQSASGRNDHMQSDQQGDRNARGRGDQGAAGRDGGGARNGAGETMADRAGGGRYI